VFFISLKSYQSVDVENGFAWAIWTFVAHIMAKRRGWESNWQFDSRPLKVENRPDLGACRWSVIDHWKSLEKRYKFALNLIPIEGLSKEL